MNQPQVFYTYEWSMAVYRAYGNVRPPLLFFAYDSSDMLCGVAALAFEPLTDSACFLCSTTGDYCDFISEPADREIFLQAVLEQLDRLGINRIILANLPADSNSIAALKASSALQKFHRFATTAYVCTQVNLASLERRSNGSLVLPRKKMVRHSLNALGRDTPVRFDNARTIDAVQSVLPEFMKAHVIRFLYTGRVSNIAREARRVFLTELAQLLSDRGWIVISRMLSGNKTVSWNYGFCFQGSWFWYQPTFDSQLEKYSPGFCLLIKLIEEAATNPELQMLDLGLGAEEYKNRVANQTRRTLHVTMNKSLVRHCRDIVRYGIGQTVHRLTILDACARKLQNRLLGLRKHIRARGIGSTLSHIAQRVRDMFWSKREVLFFEWFGSVGDERSDQFELRQLGWSELGDAVMQYSEDPLTVEYLLRAASRLRSGLGRGYCLTDKKGNFLHFAWSTAFQEFYISELKQTFSSPGESTIIFDCWTPPTRAGQGHYSRALAAIAKKLAQEGQRPWISGVRTNVPSIRGIERAGFHLQYQVVRKCRLGWKTLTRETPSSTQVRITEAVAGV